MPPLTASSVRLASSLQRCTKATPGPLRPTASVAVWGFVSISTTRSGPIFRPTPVPNTSIKARSHARYPQLRRNGIGSSRAAYYYSTNANTSSHGRKLTADDYIQELQDLYEIAKDELEIADESTTAGTIYAASDRVTLREAFDDLDRAYAAYTGTTPTPTPPSDTDERTVEDRIFTTAGAREDAESGDMGVRGEEGEISAAEREAGLEEELGRAGEGSPRTNYDPRGVTPEIREEIQRRIGQRIREMRNAVEALEERGKEE